MQTQLTDVLGWVASLLAGGAVGVVFGMIQETARRRYQKLEGAGRFANGWAVIPGSMSRVAFLLVALALVQVLCPLLFTQTRQWWVSGGVVAGYAFMLYRQLRQRLAQQH